jgi:hypothetical protein
MPGLAPERAPLGPLLRTLVASLGLVPVGCFGGSSDEGLGSPGKCGDIYKAEVTARDLDAVDGGDGRIGEAECWALCESATRLGELTWDADYRLYASDTGGVDTGVDSHSRRGCEATRDDAGTYTVACRTDWNQCPETPGGRGHVRLRAAPTSAGQGPVAGWLARMAHAEAGSVLAFGFLLEELESHGLPEPSARGSRRPSSTSSATRRSWDGSPEPMARTWRRPASIPVRPRAA